jgi:aubergine-like protein
LTKKVLPEETKPTQPGKPLEISQHSVESRAMTPVRRSGAAGKPISLAANFIRLEVLEGCGIFEYEVSFVPSLDVLRNRFLCLGQHRDVIGISKMFDGKKLILPKRLPKDNTKLQSELEDADGQLSTITVIINFKYKKPAGDPDCVQLFNVIYNRVFKELKLCPLSRSGAGGSKSRNYFDPVNRNSLQKHGLEVWPGYVIAVDEFEGGVQLQVDSISRVMKTQTVRETILDCLKKFGASGYKDAAIKLVVGTQVITRYNNATYKIDELDFDATPLDTFSDEKGSNLKMTEYYKSKYGITVKDENQPLLVSYKHKTGLEKPFKICLIPELCFGVGLTDAQKADFRIMKDIATFTRLRPTEKQEVLKKLILSIQGNEKAKAHLTDWGLKLSDDNIRLQGRVIDPITLHFGGGYKEAVNAKGDWGRASTSRPVLQSVDLTKWCLIYPRRDEETAKNLVKVLQQVSPKMGLRVEQPRPLAVTQDKNEEYLKAIRSMPSESQLVVVIFPGARRADRYAAIKKLCNIERPIPSQVVMQKTLSNEKRIQAVVQKIALQMNAKLGGELWGLKIPIKSLMVIGIDVYRDKGANGSEIAGVVASLDDAYGKYYSDVVFKSKNDSIVDCLRKCIRKYRAGNGVLAKHIVIYRDGMGSGQLSVAKTEGSNFASELRNTYKEEQMKLNITGENEIVPTVTVIVVQKRLNTKLFYIPNDNKPALVENPPAGTIMDHTITHRNWYDFYMVPMSVTQGTVSPTHFTVVYDDSRFTPDVMQKLSYALTHMYFNWPGNVKVPAPCQYSHKLVELVGDHMHGKPNEQLQDKLFYL